MGNTVEFQIYINLSNESYMLTPKDLEGANDLGLLILGIVKIRVGGSLVDPKT